MNMLFHNWPEKPCVVEPPRELSTGINIAGEMTCPTRFCTDRLGALATTVSPVSWKPPQNDNIPLHGRRWKAIAKMTLVETPWRGVCEQLPLLSAGLRAQNVFSLKRTMIISELRGSPGCGCLPRYVALQFVCDSDNYPVMMKTLTVSWEWVSNAPKHLEKYSKDEKYNTYHIHSAYLIKSHPDSVFKTWLSYKSKVDAR